MADEWSDRRKEVTYEEARTVLDHQLQTLADIDDKALRTVRLTIVLVGIVVTAIEYDFIGNVNRTLLISGGIFLFSSLLIGMMTYSESDLFLGPNQSYLRQLATGQFHDTTWDDDLLLAMAYWAGENREDIEWNGFLLTLTQATLLVGLLFVAIAVVF